MGAINERIRGLRKSLGLTQQEFSSRLGISRNTVATYEVGPSSPSESALTLICKTWNVNPEWLRTGEGEMYFSSPMDALKEFARDNGLTKEEAVFLRDFISLPPDMRKAAIDFTLKVADDIRHLQSEDRPYTESDYEKDLGIVVKEESTTSNISEGTETA